MFLDNKGQASAEFIFVTLIAVIVIGSLVSVIGSNQDKTQVGDVGGATIMGQKIAETVNTAYINGNGYSLTLNLSTLNSTMNSTAYPFSFTAVISNSTGSGVVTVTTGANNIAINLIPTKFNGTGYNNLTSNGIYTVTNLNGTIQII
jgi:hypothetical protein